MSRLRTNIITNRMANGAPTVSNGLVISGVTTTSEVFIGNNIKLDSVSGIVTATSFSGSGANLTSLPAANLTGTLPAISGANLINLDASDLASGTIPDARFPSTLPAVSGANLTGISAGILMADQWLLTSNFSPGGAVSLINSGWGQVSRAGYGVIGSSMTESSGVFTYPQTGIYFVQFTCGLISTSAQRYMGSRIQTTHNNYNYAHATDVNSHCALNNSFGAYIQTTSSVIQDVQDVTQDKVRFSAVSFTPGDTTVQGDSSRAVTHVTFIRLGDT